MYMKRLDIYKKLQLRTRQLHVKKAWEADDYENMKAVKVLFSRPIKQVIRKPSCKKGKSADHTQGSKNTHVFRNLMKESFQSQQSIEGLCNYWMKLFKSEKIIT